LKNLEGSKFSSSNGIAIRIKNKEVEERIKASRIDIEKSDENVLEIDLKSNEVNLLINSINSNISSPQLVDVVTLNNN
jgi:hypothetical protein